MAAARAPSVPDTLADSWTAAGGDGLESRVYGWRANSGDRPAVIWGHANGFAAGAYEPMLSELAAEVDVFAYDLRAHGGSGDPGSDFEGDYDRAMSADRLGLDLFAVVQSIRRRTPTQPLHFAGHSISGLGALRMGAVFDHAPFRSMTLFEPPLAPTPDVILHGPAAQLGEFLSNRALRRRREVADPDAFAASLAERGAFSRWRADMLKAYADATLIETADGWRLRCPPEAEAAGYRTTMDTSTFRALATFDRPILFVESDPTMDGVAPSWATKAQGVAAAQAPKGRLERIPGTSHMMPFERPDAVMEIVMSQVGVSDHGK